MAITAHARGGVFTFHTTDPNANGETKVTFTHVAGHKLDSEMIAWSIAQDSTAGDGYVVVKVRYRDGSGYLQTNESETSETLQALQVSGDWSIKIKVILEVWNGTAYVPYSNNYHPTAWIVVGQDDDFARLDVQEYGQDANYWKWLEW